MARALSLTPPPLMRQVLDHVVYSSSCLFQSSSSFISVPLPHLFFFFFPRGRSRHWRHKSPATIGPLGFHNALLEVPELLIDKSGQVSRPPPQGLFALPTFVESLSTTPLFCVARKMAWVDTSSIGTDDIQRCDSILPLMFDLRIKGRL